MKMKKWPVYLVAVNFFCLVCYHQWFSSLITIRVDKLNCPSLQYLRADNVEMETSRDIHREVRQMIQNWETLKEKLLDNIQDENVKQVKVENLVEARGIKQLADERGQMARFGKVNLKEQPITCPDFPAGLEGNRSCDCEPVTEEELQKMFPELQEGRLKPYDCKPRERLAIIIPYRDRYSHLHILIKMLVPLLKKQKADATFFVVEQDDYVPFNRALLQNVGFLESQKLGSFDCYIFHDADLVPMNEQILYRCAENPRLFPVAIKKYGRRTPRVMFNGYFGGVVGLSKSQFLDVNGNSNLYFGWGGEDDDLLIRANKKSYKLTKEDPRVYHYGMLRHERNDKKQGNVDRKLLLATAEDRQDVEGLSTTRYKLKQIRKERLYIWISVAINMTEVFQTAPDYTLAVLNPRSHRQVPV